MYLFLSFRSIGVNWRQDFSSWEYSSKYYETQFELHSCIKNFFGLKDFELFPWFIQEIFSQDSEGVKMCSTKDLSSQIGTIHSPLSFLRSIHLFTSARKVRDSSGSIVSFLPWNWSIFLAGLVLKFYFVIYKRFDLKSVFFTRKFLQSRT